MNHNAAEQLEEQLRLFYRDVKRGDAFLVQCYLAGISVAVLCFLIPSGLSRLGSGLVILALSHMICRILLAHRSGHEAGGTVPGCASLLARLQPRLLVSQSLLFNLPFLAGANLMFIGLPLSLSPLAKATLDCLFLAASVVLYVVGFIHHQTVLRRRLAPILNSPAVASQTELFRRQNLASPGLG